MENIDKEKSSFEFEGYSIGGLKSHKGTFDDFTVSLQKENGKISEISGSAKINSVNTGIEKLNGHLKSKDFFDAEQFPIIVFKSKSLNNNIVKGDLTFHGVTNEISFPITQTPGSVSAEFKLNTKDFDFNKILVSSVVDIKFTFSN